VRRKEDRMKYSKIVLGIAAILFFSFTLLSQTSGNAKFRGIVTDEATGLPLDGVKVRMLLISAGAEKMPPPVTDKEGKWTAYYIRIGMWNLDFEKVGYFPYKMSIRAVVELGSKIPEIEIKMRKIEGLVVTANIMDQIKTADLLFSEKKFAEARALYEKVQVEYPDFYVIYKNIGNSYFSEQNYDKAIEAYKKVLEKQPQSPDVFTAIANAYNNWGKFAEATEWYRKVPFEQIKDIDTAYNTGVLLYNAGTYEDAVRYFQKAVEIDPQFADGYYQLGMTYAGVSKNAEAIEALNKFMSLAPDSPNFQTAKAIVDAFSKIK
jgi:tetratricopeptide (TPR) repeat protein